MLDSCGRRSLFPASYGSREFLMHLNSVHLNDSISDPRNKKAHCFLHN